MEFRNLSFINYEKKINNLTKILVIVPYSTHEYFVRAEFIKSWDEELNPGESVAWNGSLSLYCDQKGQYYLQYHTGNSAHRVWAVEVPESVKDLSAIDAKEYILT